MEKKVVRLKDLKKGDWFKRANAKSDMFEILSEPYESNDKVVVRCKNRSQIRIQEISVTFEVYKI